jgi:hypothetical protein
MLKVSLHKPLPDTYKSFCTTLVILGAENNDLPTDPKFPENSEILISTEPAAKRSRIEGKCHHMSQVYISIE